MAVLLGLLFLAVGVFFMVRALRRSPKTKSSKPPPPQPVTIQVTMERRVETNFALSDSSRPPGDNWEGDFWEAENARSISKRINLHYVDGRGTRTEREVLVRQFDVITDLFIGHCFLRNATRTFRFSRIVSCSDAETGEVIPDFKQSCIDQYRDSPDHSIDVLLAEHRDVLLVTYFVGKADGRLTKKEMAEIAELSASIIGDPRLDAEAFKKVFTGWNLPSLHTYRTAIGRLKSKPLEYRGKLVAACDAMVATEAKASDAEREAVAYLREKLLPE